MFWRLSFIVRKWLRGNFCYQLHSTFEFFRFGSHLGHSSVVGRRVHIEMLYQRVFAKT
jgi:hypothetical protein